MTTSPARLSMLKKSLEDMSIEELREHVRFIRKDRRISKEKPKEKKARTATAKKVSTSMTNLMDNMTPEEIKALLRELEGNDYDSEGSADQGNQG